MRKRFNVNGICYPDEHYMINLDSRVEKIIQDLVLQNKYFTINRARQYGKTTTLDLLYRRLAENFSVFLLSFEDMGSASFSDEHQFCRTFLRLLKTQIDYGMTAGIPEDVSKEMEGDMEQRKQDHHTGMDISNVSQMIWDYTEGYPYLVARLCQSMDEQTDENGSHPDRSAAWTREGLLSAVKSFWKNEIHYLTIWGKNCQM